VIRARVVDAFSIAFLEARVTAVRDPAWCRRKKYGRPQRRHIALAQARRRMDQIRAETLVTRAARPINADSGNVIMCAS